MLMLRKNLFFICVLLCILVFSAGCIQEQRTYEAQNISIESDAFVEENMTTSESKHETNITGVNISATIITKEYRYTKERPDNSFTLLQLTGIPKGSNQVEFTFSHDKLIDSINSSDGITLRNVTKVDNSTIMNEYHGEVNKTEYNATAISQVDNATFEGEVKIHIVTFGAGETDIIGVGIHERGDVETRMSIIQVFKTATVENGSSVS